jgi:hypothetical protein
MDIATRLDPLLAAVESHDEPDPRPLLELLVRYSGLTRRTPRERVVAAVAEEIGDLVERARVDHPDLPPGPAFPRDRLSTVDRSAVAYDSFAERVGWLLNGTTPEQLSTVDPIRDCDRIFHAVGSAFRVEARLLDLLTILRIAQSSVVSLFFRSTREAEDNAVLRFHDTMGLFANFFEWGADSRRGRAAVARINQIHGRYAIPDEGMRFVLLNGAFTWIEGADRIGHRALSDVERRGYFHAYVKLGRAMHIAGLSDDYDEMYRWFLDFASANAAPHPLKRETFERLAVNSLATADVPGLTEMLLAAAVVGMPDTYRLACGYPAPSAAQREKVRGVFYTLGSLAELLPRTVHLRSLQNNPARPHGSPPPERMGVDARSPHLPVIAAGLPNGGFPEGQRPLLDPGDAAPVHLPHVDWAEVAKHDRAESLWVVIAGEVFDLTDWARLHPGGLDVLLRVAGRDGTAAFAAAGHPDAVDVFRLNYRIGRVA